MHDTRNNYPYHVFCISTLYLISPLTYTPQVKFIQSFSSDLTGPRRTYTHDAIGAIRCVGSNGFVSRLKPPRDVAYQVHSLSPALNLKCDRRPQALIVAVMHAIRACIQWHHGL